MTSPAASGWFCDPQLRDVSGQLGDDVGDGLRAGLQPPLHVRGVYCVRVAAAVGGGGGGGSTGYRQVGTCVWEGEAIRDCRGSQIAREWW